MKRPLCDEVYAKPLHRILLMFMLSWKWKNILHCTLILASFFLVFSSLPSLSCPIFQAEYDALLLQQRKQSNANDNARRRIWDMMQCSLFYLEEGGIMSIRNIAASLPDYKISPSLFFLHEAVSIYIIYRAVMNWKILRKQC
jgi:hypothetical protein